MANTNAAISLGQFFLNLEISVIRHGWSEQAPEEPAQPPMRLSAFKIDTIPILFQGKIELGKEMQFDFFNIAMRWKKR